MNMWYYRLRNWYYRLRNWMLSFHGLPVGNFDGSHPPRFGKGKYVSVFQHGPYIDIKDEVQGEIIRIIPYQPNHGVFVEIWKDNKLCGRGIADIMTLKAICGRGNEDIRKLKAVARQYENK